jgi:hypothetical protein
MHQWKASTWIPITAPLNFLAYPVAPSELNFEIWRFDILRPSRAQSIGFPFVIGMLLVKVG